MIPAPGSPPQPPVLPTPMRPSSPSQDAGSRPRIPHPSGEAGPERQSGTPDPAGGVEIHFPVSILPDGTVDWDVFLPPRAADVPWRVGQRMKRVIDLMVAAASLLVLLPVLVAVGILVLVTSGTPIFYSCEYMGHRGRRFRLYKFRTMVPNADAMKAELAHLNHVTGPAFKIRDDPRITPLGGFLRRFSIDELPQLWNVLRGDMSLVGPRPPLPEEWREFKPWHRGKLSVVPGITCLWQVEGRSDITDFDEWAMLDLQYIRDWSILTDIVILLRTVPVVLRGHGAY
jgi:lipopolysaccharide/colanic/teichoic acid biosynthesis glycosyltransferase